MAKLETIHAIHSRISLASRRVHGRGTGVAAFAEPGILMVAPRGFSARHPAPGMAVALRVTAGVGAGYVFIACGVPLLASALTLAGMQRSEAVVLAACSVFPSISVFCSGPSACEAWRGSGQH